MQANELMIGDWVIPHIWDADSKPSKIVGIQYNSYRGNDYIDWVDCEVWDELSMDDIKPIPLTPEILKQNGWVYNNEDEKFFPQTWVGDGLMLQGADDCGYCIVVTSDYDDEDTNVTPFIILYVHELQHVLKLRRINKEIIV